MPLKASELLRIVGRVAIVAAICLMAAHVPAFAQPATTSPSSATIQPTREQLETQLSILNDYIKKHEGQWKNTAAVDPSVMDAYVKAQKKEYEYEIEKMNIIIGAYEAQRLASYVVLCLVVLVVVAGVVFSAFQLWKSISVGVQPSSELEVSASKVRVTSSVVGVVVLTISLVFLYIYANEIYHIRILGSSETGAVSK